MKQHRLEKYESQQVSLACDTGSMDVGNPPCRTFTWKKLEKVGQNVIIGRNGFEFIMEEADEGNYTCRCENEYGSSDRSDAAQLIFLPGKPPSETCKFCPVVLSFGITPSKSEKDQRKNNEHQGNLSLLLPLSLDLKRCKMCVSDSCVEARNVISKRLSSLTSVIFIGLK